MSEIPALTTFDELYDFAASHGLEETADLLRSYVAAGQPDNWMPGFTARALCRCAAMGIVGTPRDEVPGSYLDTALGSLLYWQMWGDQI